MKPMNDQETLNAERGADSCAAPLFGGLNHSKSHMAKIGAMRTHASFVRGGKKSWDKKSPEKKMEAQRARQSARVQCEDMKLGIKCWSAKNWRLRDPNNRVWQFRNLTHFVRTHEHLFAPEDVRWVIPKNGKLTGVWCRATGGLRTLRPSRQSVVCGTWKGWRWTSIYERRFNDGDDLMLGRELPPNAKLTDPRLKRALNEKGQR